MSNKLIHTLEKYFGFLICFLLDIWHVIFSDLFRAKKNRETKKVVFVKFIEQGALVLHRTAFEKATKIYGKENVYLCTFSSNSELAHALDVFYEKNIIHVRETSILSFIGSFSRALLTIRRLKIDSIIDLEFFSRATAIFCYLSGCVNRVGYHRFGGSETYRGNLFTHKLNYSPYEHVSETSIMLLNALSYHPSVLPSFTVKRIHAEPQFMYVPNTDRLSHWKNTLFTEKGVLWIILNPNFNDPLPLRQWNQDNYSEFIHGLRKWFPQSRFIFTGRDDEFAKTQSFIEMNNLSGTVNLCGKTSIHDLLTIYNLAHLMVASDSGPGHFASLTPIHSIVLFGPETPQLYGPKGRNTHVMYKGISCSPCFNVFNNRTSDCKNNLCLKSIRPAEVVDLSIQLLRKATSPAAPEKFVI